MFKIARKIHPVVYQLKIGYSSRCNGGNTVIRYVEHMNQRFSMGWGAEDFEQWNDDMPLKPFEINTQIFFEYKWITG